MQESKNWQRKLVLLFRSEKRLNASSIVESYDGKSYEDMKKTEITKDMCDLDLVTDVRKTKDLEGHLNNLKYRSIGEPELCFYHNTLVILLRRKYKTKETFAEFERLWLTETEFLLSHLSIRWIVSACDTFIDYSNNPGRRAILMNVITLVNTLRTYETDRYLRLSTGTDLPPFNEDKKAELYKGDLPLYDGLTYFRIGTDDSLRNMRKRYTKFYKVDEFATTILLDVFEKLQNNKSAFTALRSLHKDDWSKWWQD